MPLRPFYASKLNTFFACGTPVVAFAIGISLAHGQIVNTVIATGTGPFGPPDSVVATAEEFVDVVDAAPQLAIVKSATLNDEVNADGLAEVGETTTYTYEVTNTGNVTLQNVAVQDTHEGSLLFPGPGGESIVSEGPSNMSNIGAPNDGFIDTLAVGAIATFTVTLPITQEEVDNQ